MPQVLGRTVIPPQAFGFAFFLCPKWNEGLVLLALGTRPLEELQEHLANIRSRDLSISSHCLNGENHDGEDGFEKKRPGFWMFFGDYPMFLDVGCFRFPRIFGPN